MGKSKKGTGSGLGAWVAGMLRFCGLASPGFAWTTESGFISSTRVIELGILGLSVGGETAEEKSSIPPFERLS
jgi:hypothetical protein